MHMQLYLYSVWECYVRLTRAMCSYASSTLLLRVGCKRNFYIHTNKVPVNILY